MWILTIEHSVSINRGTRLFTAIADLTGEAATDRR